MTADRSPVAADDVNVETAGKQGSSPHPEVTRTSGVSRVKSDSRGDPVKIRPCPGLNPYGTHDCPESSVLFVPDGTPVQMWCWTDSTVAPDGYPADHRRWFYVIQAPGSPNPGEEGYVYSALIPVSEQITTPVCTAQRCLELHPPAPPDPEPEPTQAPTPALPSLTPSPVAPTVKAPEPSPAKPATTAPPPPAKHPIREESGSHGSPTFLNAHGAKGPGEPIPAHTWVEVECRVYAPEIKSANPDGWWYRIASSPWNGSYYAVANTFMNGDTPGHTPATSTGRRAPDLREAR
ncbi:hypothetical protein [Streptomyces sp. NBC_01443]|uniref:hypothetical protein n=1 Tax=Streptomyces sp. NBC_01443 TaxID=2903868 RepID=UPI002252411B|nr:hypothetical protein [Streptomyces sp. NBC_01443]MCX4632398.1 hypothetical protein [Streptomyces sp. NBC_01443]